MSKSNGIPSQFDQKSWRKRLPGSFFWLLLPVILYVSFLLVLPGQHLDLELEQAQPLDVEWYLAHPEREVQPFSLPANLEWPAGKPLAVRTKLPMAFQEPQTLLIRSSLQTLLVLLDGEVIHSYDRLTHKAPRSPLASAWHLVRIPSHSDGQTLEIVVTSIYESMSGQINDIYYGNKASLMFWLATIYGPGLILSLLQILVGVTLLVVAFFMPSRSRKSIWALGTFAILMGTWFLAESRMMQFFLPNDLMIGSLAYVSLTLCPIPFLILVSDTVLPDNRILINRLVVLFSMISILIQLLQILGWADFFTTVMYTNLLIALSMSLILVMLVKGWLSSRSKEIVRFLTAFSILAFFAFLELANFFRNDFTGTSFFLRLGFVNFLLILAFQSLRNARQIVLQNQSALIYEKMAYEDILTGLGNRAAFERDTANFKLTETTVSAMRLVSMDLNNLKWINDHKGHAAGDEAIRLASHCLKQHFAPLGRCYRLGGDEFSCLIQPDQPELFQLNLELFQEQIQTISREVDYPFSIAIGSAVYPTEKVDSFHDFLIQVDQLMYLDKEKKPVL